MAEKLNGIKEDEKYDQHSISQERQDIKQQIKHKPREKKTPNKLSGVVYTCSPERIKVATGWPTTFYPIYSNHFL